MGASRKLQGEIDRVLKKVQEGVDVFDSIWNKVYDTDNANQKEKFEADLKKEIKKLQRYRDQIKTWIQSSEIKDKKVSASYEQALVDARKLIEREMERFKICEKETKTKAFSKEGLGQQPKTDPKEKAKSETRDWINNLVGELESQIDNFEAELEGLTVKKGKARPPRLTHLETSITRHKAHIMKLELILRLLDNDELSAEQVNDVKDFLEDYVERNQEDFDEFSDVDELYSSLPLEKVEALEDLVTMGPPGLVKGIKSQTTVSSPPLNTSIQEHNEQAATQDTNSDLGSRSPTLKSNAVGSSNLPSPGGSHSATLTAILLSNVTAASTGSAVAKVPASARGILESTGSTVAPNASLSNSVKEEEVVNFLGRRSSPSLSDSALGRGIGRGGMPSQSAISIPISPGAAVSSSAVSLGSVPLASEVTKRNILRGDDRLASSGMMQHLTCPSSSRAIFPESSKAVDADSSNVSDAAVASRGFSSVVPGMQWRPGSPMQNQNEMIRGRSEIPPDQREKFLQKLQQVQQQTQSNLLGMPNLKQFSGQQNSLLQQLTSQSLSGPSHVGLGLQAPGIGPSASVSLQQQPTSIFHVAQPGSLLNGQKDTAVEEQQQHSFADDSTSEITGSALTKSMMNEDDLKASYVKDLPIGGVSGPLSDPTQVQLDPDLSPGHGQPLHSNQPSASLGVIGRRSASDLGAIGDNLSANSPSSSVNLDPRFILQMLESAYYKLPQPKDSERSRTYIPRKPATTPASYPQFQAHTVNNPAFWERLGVDTLGTDTLFFAFYYQQDTYQQYLAAKELKKQSWRFHRKFNTWFQRHEEPKVATDEFEKGTYVYFDFHVSNDDLQHGWCQRIKHDFTFEYNYLEDELIV